MKLTNRYRRFICMIAWTTITSFQNYVYRATAFSGVRTFSGLATGGTKICSVIACTGDTIHTCGRRFPEYVENTTAIFEELVITASVPTPYIVPELEAHDSSFYPVSLGLSILPLEPQQYTYEEEVQGEVKVYTLTLEDNAVEIYSLAVWGRLFETDGSEVTPPLEDSAASVFLNSGLLMAVLLLMMR